MIRLKRFLVTALSLTFCYIMQMVVLPRIPYLIAVPNLLLIEVLSVGFLFGKAYGLAVGVVCGFLMDILGTGTWGFYTLIFAWLGYGNGVLSDHSLRRRFSGCRGNADSSAAGTGTIRQLTPVFFRIISANSAREQKPSLRACQMP